MKRNFMRTISAFLALIMLLLITSACGSEKGVLDMTKMSDTLIYSTIQNMNKTPEGYLGMTVILSGAYAKSYFEETGNYYHFVTGIDNTGCCTWGYEFILDEEVFSYPDENTKITVRGKISSYNELGVDYYYIDVEDISAVSPSA